MKRGEGMEVPSCETIEGWKVSIHQEARRTDAVQKQEFTTQPAEQAQKDQLLTCFGLTPSAPARFLAMNNSLFILQPNDRPEWLEYPHSFCRIVDQALIHVTPWHIMEGERALVHFQGLAERYPSRDLFPFAYRQDNDDVACWAKGMGEKVFIIHDFASPGYENEGAFDDGWTWFRSAVDETIDWD